jgi:hypothetical protein
MAAREQAECLDRVDLLAHTRSEFLIPTRAQIASKYLADPGLSKQPLLKTILGA